MKEYTLITGSSSGIGESISVLLSQNRNIIIHGRNVERLNQVKQKCKNPSKVIVWNFDLNNVESVEESLGGLILENNITIVSLVYSSGIMKMFPLKVIGIKNIYESLNVNLISAILITKTLQQKVNSNKLKSVVYISSNVSNFGAKGMSSYAMTKSALDSFMRCMAIELAPKVRLNSVLPGGVQTNMTKSIFEDTVLIERIKSSYPLGLGNVDDIANLVVFLLSDASRWLTGQQFIIDGGRTINISG